MMHARLIAILLAASALSPQAVAEAPRPFQLAQTAEEPGAEEPEEGTEEAAPSEEPADAAPETAPTDDVLETSPEPSEGEEIAPAEEGVTPDVAPAPEETAPADDAFPSGEGGVEPAPAPAEPAPAAPAEPAPAPPAGEGAAAPLQPQSSAPPPAVAGGLPAIERDPARLPEPVRKTWTDLVAAARSGDIERLRPLIQAQPEPPIFAFDDIDDPLSYLRSLSGDAEGREILAILLEMLEAGYVHVDQGTPQEMYVWPYFARYPVDRLTPEQMVELFTLLTAGDYQDMRSYGAYIFFRVGIGPDGVWHFFVAGD